MTRVPLIAAVVLVCVTGAWAEQPRDQQFNELTPAAELWAPYADGVLVQIAVPDSEILVSETRLPVVVWFRNTTKKPVAILSQARRAYMPHGAITMTGADGKNIIGGVCHARHDAQAIVLPSEGQRGFLCDAFDQMCHGRPTGELVPGKYEVQCGQSNKVTVEVFKQDAEPGVGADSR